MASVIRIDGTVQDIGQEPSLEKLQETVGGYIESVAIPDSDTGVLIVNEDGVQKGLALNVEASLIARRPLVGDVVVCVETPDGRLL
jgi:hypothetical protein